MIDATIERLLGSRVVDRRRVGGGDVNESFAARLDDGRTIFVKTNTSAPPDMFEAEARGLELLRGARALGVPEVLGVSTEPPMLVLAFVESGPRSHETEELLGRGLAMLHRQGLPSFGLDHDNYVGPLPQSNAPEADWSTFYGQRRLTPQIARAGTRLPAEVRRDLDAVLERLPDLVGPDEPPSRLHGDLWTGNVLVDEVGAPVLVDPAVYGGHREVDLAMLRLFGSPSARLFDAYEEVHPRAAGHDARVALYQLYPLLVHVNLFGAGYVGSVRDTAKRALAAA